MIRRIALFCILMYPCVCDASPEEPSDTVQSPVLFQSQAAFTGKNTPSLFQFQAAFTSKNTPVLSQFQAAFTGKNTPGLCLCTSSAFLPKHQPSPRRVDPSGNTGDMEWDGWDNESGAVSICDVSLLFQKMSASARGVKPACSILSSSSSYRQSSFKTN